MQYMPCSDMQCMPCSWDLYPAYQCWFEPAHEIMALFVPRKLILQTRMRSHPVGLDVWLLVWPFIYFHSSCVRTAKALARLRGCASSPEPALVAYAISTIILWPGSFWKVKDNFSQTNNFTQLIKFGVSFGCSPCVGAQYCWAILQWATS